MPDPLLKVLLVGVGGAAGALSRYGITGLAQLVVERFPLGTLLANVRVIADDAGDFGKVLDPRRGD